MRDAFISSLINKAKIDSRICLLTGDLGFGVVEKFQSIFPDRFWNCGVAEQSMLSISAGLAKSGMRPFVYSIANFPTFRALEQIRNDICYHNLSVTVVTVGGGLGYGTLGYTHHGIEDIGAVRILPNINVYSPADPIESEQVLTEICNLGSPAYLRLGKNGEPKIEGESINQLPGSIREIVQGTDLTILSTGAVTENCRAAAIELKNQNLSVQVISIPKVQPIEISFLTKVITSRNLLVVEEHVERGGLASALFESFNKVNFKAKIAHLFVKEKNISEIGSQEFLRSLSNLDKTSIMHKCKQIVHSIS